MADVFSPNKRSEIMSKVKGRGNLATELKLAALFRQRHIRGWRRHVKMFGRPDFVFASSRVAVFVDGCFWHGCPIHGAIPATNREFWGNKLAANKKRDQLVKRELEKSGWTVLRIWQHELRSPDKLARRIDRVLARHSSA